MTIESMLYEDETFNVAEQIFEENIYEYEEAYKTINKNKFKLIKKNKELSDTNAKTSNINKLKLALKSLNKLSLRSHPSYRKQILFRLFVIYRRLTNNKTLLGVMLHNFKKIVYDLKESFTDLRREIKEELNEDLKNLKEYEKKLNEYEIYIQAKQIYNSIKKFYLKFLYEIKHIQIQGFLNRVKTLRSKEIFNQIKSLSLKEIVYKVKSFLIKNILLFIKKSKESFSKLKNFTLEKTLFFINNLENRFSKIKDFSGKQLYLFITMIKEIVNELKELTMEERLGVIKILYNKGKYRIYKRYFRIKKAILLFFIENKIIFGEKTKEYSLELKNKLNEALSNSKQFQDYKNKINNIKLFILNLRDKIEEFLINFTYNHDVTKEYLKRILFVFGIYSLPLLILIKSFYGCLLKVAQTGDIRFDEFIPTSHLQLILSDTRAGIDYIPLKFIPKFLQSIDIDFYIFLSYYTLFGTSKFSLNKELVYHGVLCVAHLVVYASMGLIMSITQNLAELYVMILNASFRAFVARKFKYLTKRRALHKISEVLRLRKGLSLLPDEFDNYGLCGYDKLISEVQLGADVFVISSILTPISLYVVITLIYNCCYYIRYNKRPFIPIMTDFAKRLTPNVKKDE